MVNYYRSGSSSTSYYPSSSVTTEPDMRQEFINTLDGKHPEIAKAQTGLIRQMRRTSSGLLISCSCVDSLTREPDRDRFCPICFSEGKIWNEELITFYRVPINSDVNNAQLNSSFSAGYVNAGLAVFYIRYSAGITRYDKLVELELDVEGDPVSPYNRIALYRIEAVWDYRSDEGKLEYYKIFAHEEKPKYLNAPEFEDLAP